MTSSVQAFQPCSLFIPRSTTDTLDNKTGSWRFLRPRYEEKTAPCSAACPAGEDIGRIEMLVVQERFKEAWEAVLMENPFPSVCGRVCYHPCEKACNRGEFDQPVAIRHLERFLADAAARFRWTPDPEFLSGPARDEGSRPKRKVAVAGAGPSGLAAAFFLGRLGYACDVFAAMDEPGGVLRYGIPAYRLPVEVLRREIEQARQAGGFAIHCGRPFSLKLLEEARPRYDAVFVGCGHWKSLELSIPGEDSGGVEDGLAFLKRMARGEKVSLSGPVAVIGGGNTAIDVARSVRRLGGRPILVYRRRKGDMPAFRDEIAMALEEGVELMELRSPVKIHPRGDGWEMELQVMEVTEEGPDGRARTVPVAGRTEGLRVSRVFKAIGLDAAEEWHRPPGEGPPSLTLDHSVLVAPENGPVVAYGGDLVNDIKSVVDAVASGKEAALALDAFFRQGLEAVGPALEGCVVGDGPSLSMEIHLQGPRRLRSPHVVAYQEINIDHFRFSPRMVQPRLLREERVQSFDEIDLKVSAQTAVKEAERCFHCGLCNQCDNCRLFCPDLAVVRDDGPGGRHIDYDYCKGCGICVVECPRNAMALEEEGAREETA